MFLGCASDEKAQHHTAAAAVFVVVALPVEATAVFFGDDCRLISYSPSSSSRHFHVHDSAAEISSHMAVIRRQDAFNDTVFGDVEASIRCYDQYDDGDDDNIDVCHRHFRRSAYYRSYLCLSSYGCCYC